MSVRYLVGIDFGHGETTASYIDLQSESEDPQSKDSQSKRPMPLKLQNTGKMDNFKIPSVIYWGPVRDGSFKYSLCENGKDTEEDEGFITPPAVCLSFKDTIRNLQGYSNEKQRNAFFTFIRLVYQRLLLYNKNILEKDGSNFLLFIASPTRWTTQEKDDYKQFVEQAIDREIGWVINESDAASYKMKQDGLVLVVDFGSSTIDFTLMYNNRKINIDDCSNQHGAQTVEWTMWDKYRHAPDTDGPNGYNTVIKKQGEKGKTEHNMRYINLDDWLMLILRERKEELYTRIRSLTGFSLIDPLIKRMFDFQGYNACQILFEDEEFSNEFLGGYMQDVSDSFKKVKDVIEQNAELRSYGVDIKDLKIVLSGGASRMPWVKEALEKVFVGVPIEWDFYPEYIVSDGIVEYAYALYRVRTTIAEELSKFEVWLSGQDRMLSELISGVCREACLKRMENDPEIKNYRSEQFADGTVEDKIPENPFKNYYKSSIKGLVMDIIAPINKLIWENRVSINKEISEDLKREIRKVLDGRFRDSFSTLFRVAPDQVNLAGNQNGLVLPSITSDFTIGMNKLKEIADRCMDAKGKWNVNTLYGDGFLQKGSYRKERDSDNRKKIADVYFEYIRQQIFEPYLLDVVKERIFGYAVDTIVKAVEHYLAFNPCGCDLAEEIKRELKIETINVCDSPTTQK